MYAVTVSPASVNQGQTVTITVVVKNQGDSLESFDVTTKYDSTMIASQRVGGLWLGDSRTLYFLWDTSGVTPATYSISAVADTVPGEVGNADNTRAGGVVAVTPRTDTMAPIWPYGSALTTSNIGGTSLVLAWTAAVDDVGVVSYRVYNGNTILATIPRSVFSYNVTGLIPETGYTFRLEAGDEAENWSNNGPSLNVTTTRSDLPESPPQGFPLLRWEYWIVAGAGFSATLLVLGVRVVRRRKAGVETQG